MSSRCLVESVWERRCDWCGVVIVKERGEPMPGAQVVIAAWDPEQREVRPRHFDSCDRCTRGVFPPSPIGAQR